MRSWHFNHALLEFGNCDQDIVKYEIGSCKKMGIKFSEFASFPFCQAMVQSSLAQEDKQQNKQQDMKEDKQADKKTDTDVASLIGRLQSPTTAFGRFIPAQTGLLQL